MRVDPVISRLQNALEQLKTTAQEIELSSTGGHSSGMSCVNLSGFYTSPPLCVGYFNIASQSPTPLHDKTQSSVHSLPLQTEEFQFGDGRAILLHRVVILAKDETLLNGSVVGRSHPSPSSCQITAWCSDLLTVRGRLVSLVGNQSSRADGSVWLVPPTESLGRTVAPQLVTDRILLKGQFERLTVCIYGWPLDIHRDDRFASARKLISSGVFNSIGRLVCSPTFPDINPSDANTFQRQLASLPLPPSPDDDTLSAPQTSALSSGETLLRLEPYIQESNFHRLLMASTNSEQASYGQKFSSRDPTTSSLKTDTSSSAIKNKKLQIPAIQVLQQLSCEVLYYLELHETAYQCNTEGVLEHRKKIHRNRLQNEEKLRPVVPFSELLPSESLANLTPGEKALLESSTWCRFISLLFWPLEYSASYERYIELCKQLKLYHGNADKMMTPVSNGNLSTTTQRNEGQSVSHEDSLLTLWDSSLATPEQRALCLQMLGACISTSLSLCRLFIRLDGHWGAALQAELEISKSTLSAISHSSPLFQKAIVKLNETKQLFGFAPRSASKVKIAALQLLSVCSSRQFGVEALIAVPPSIFEQDFVKAKIRSDSGKSSTDHLPKSETITVSEPVTMENDANPNSEALLKNLDRLISEPTVGSKLNKSCSPKDRSDIKHEEILSNSSPDTEGKKQILGSLYECLTLASLEERDRVAFSRIRYNSILQTILHRVRLYLSVRSVLAVVRLLRSVTRQSSSVALSIAKVENETVDKSMGSVTDDSTNESTEANMKSKLTESSPVEVDLDCVRAAIVLLLENLCCLAPLAQWNPLRQQELDEIGNGFKATLNSRLSRLTQVGSFHGERNDGFGFDNHYLSQELTHEEDVYGLLRLIEGTTFLRDLVFSLRETGRLTSHINEIFGNAIPLPSVLMSSSGVNYSNILHNVYRKSKNLSEEKVVEKYLSPFFTKSIRNNLLKDILNGRHIFRVLHHSATVDGPTIPEPGALSLIDLCNLAAEMSHEILFWILRSPTGMTTFLSQYPSIPLKKQMLSSAQSKLTHQEVTRCDVVTSDLEGEMEDDITNGLPEPLSSLISDYATAYGYIEKISEIEVTTELPQQTSPTAEAISVSYPVEFGMDELALNSERGLKRTREVMEGGTPGATAEQIFPEALNNKQHNYVSIPLNLLRELCTFTEDKNKCNALAVLLSEDVEMVQRVGILFAGLAKRQLEIEKQELDGETKMPRNGSTVDQDIMLDIQLTSDPTSFLKDESPISIEKERSSAATIAALRFMCRILWRLFWSTKSNKIVSILSSFCLDELIELRQLSKVGVRQQQWMRNIASTEHGALLSSSGTSSVLSDQDIISERYGEGDLSIDAYDNLDNANECQTQDDINRGGIGMLKSILPSSSFTNLRQVFFRDIRFRHEIADLHSAVQLSLKGESVFLGSSCAIPQTSAEEFLNGGIGVTSTSDLNFFNNLSSSFSDPSTSLLNESPTNDASKPLSTVLSPNDAVLPSHNRLITFLAFILESCSTASPPFDLVPVSESVQIAATAAAGGTTGGTGVSSTIAEKLGGYAGTLGVPVVEVQPIGPDHSVGVTTAAPTVSKGFTIFPPPKPYGWTMHIYTCLRMLLCELHTGLPSRNTNELLRSVFPDEVACALKSNTFDAPHIALQENSESLRRSLVRVLLRFSAGFHPSVVQIGFSGGEMTLQAFKNWKSSATELLPVTESALLLLYELLDACLPTAPYPVSPAPYLKPSHRFICSVSRYSSTTGCSWVGGQLIDSALVDAIMLLITRLCQFKLTFLSEKQNRLDLLYTLQGPKKFIDASLYSNDPSSQVTRCMDLLSSVLRLWGARCPDVQPMLLTTAIRHARISPSAFITGPLVLSALGGLGAVLPNAECSFCLAASQPPIVAAELNGAEGRNLEAVVMRLKQQFLQKRHAESLRSGVGGGTGQGLQGSAGGKLPPSMTTLTLSARCRLPLQTESAFFGIGVPHYFICQISLTPPAPPTGGVLPPLLPSNVCYSGPAGYSWVRKRLGRLTMADDLLSMSVFNPDGTTQQQASGRSGLPPTTTGTDLAAVPEWASYEHLRELFQTSLDEDAIESTFGSDRVPSVALGLSPATVVTITESRAAAREMLSQLIDDSLAEGKQHLQRLEKLRLKLRDIKTEDIGELFELLIASSFTSNTLLHASTASAVAAATWSNAPPIFDIIIHTAHTMVKNLSAFLAKELADNRSLGISQLFLLSRLFIFIDNTFSFFPTPTLEAAASLIRLASAGLEALQAVPVIDPNCPTYPVLRGLFDCLLPAATRLLRSGVETFSRFLALLSAPTIEQLNSGLAIPPPGTTPSGVTATAPQISAATLLALKSQGVSPTGTILKNPARFLNVMIANQFKIILRKPGTPIIQFPPSIASGQVGTQTRSAPNITPTTISQLDLVSGVLSGIRSSCLGLSAILNQLPVAWDVISRPGSGIDPLASSDTHDLWTGLSLSTVADVMGTLQLLTLSNLFCCASLYYLPDAFLEPYLDTISAMKNPSDTTKSKFPVTPTKPIPNAAKSLVHAHSATDVAPSISGGQTNLPNLAVGGTPDPAIKLDAFICLVTEAMMTASKTLVDNGKRFSDNKSVSPLPPDTSSANVSDESQVISSHKEEASSSPNLSPSDFQRYRILFGITRDLLATTANLFYRCGFTSAQLLLPLITADPINSETFGRENTSSQRQNDVDAAELYGDLDTAATVMQRETTEMNGVNATATTTGASSTTIPQLNLRESFMKDLLASFESLATANESSGPLSEELKQLFDLANPRIRELIKLRQFVSSSIVLEPPPLILRATHLIEPDLYEKSDRFWLPRLLPRSVSLAFPFCPGLPCRFPTTLVCSKARIQGGSTALSIMGLAQEMNADLLWNCSLTLDSISLGAQQEQQLFSDLLSQHEVLMGTSLPSESFFLCLPDIIKAYESGQALPSTGSLTTFFDENRQARAKGQSGGPAQSWKSPTPTPPTSIPVQRSAAVPVAEPLTGDPFRARRGPSSRAPSKHVDEYEAQQAKHAEQASTSTQQEAPEQALESIPGWAEFVTSGADSGLDVMEILKSPHLLQDPQVELKFRSLVDAHPNINALFQAMYSG